MFQLIKKDKNTLARTGVIQTAHGNIETPAYVMVATHGVVRALENEDVYRTKTQAMIANTYHLWQEKLETVQKAGGLHQFFKWEMMPLMTDSGGFQVFSFGFGREHNIGKVGILPKDIRFRRSAERAFQKEENAVTITEEGVRFSDKGKRYFLSPQKSIEIQQGLGADIIFAFDECTSPFHDYAYNKDALARTHAWAKICLASKTRKDQALYGIVQGSIFQDLRKASAKFLNTLPFDGFGIGGSFGEKEMKDMLSWTIPFLDEKKPRHLLGIGTIENILDAVSGGIDTLDCVIPTREARHGRIWTHGGPYDISKAKYQTDEPLERGCGCDACVTITRRELGEMFCSKYKNAGRLATIHNMYFFNAFMGEIRNAIQEGRFESFKKEALALYTISV